MRWLCACLAVLPTLIGSTAHGQPADAGVDSAQLPTTEEAPSTGEVPTNETPAPVPTPAAADDRTTAEPQRKKQEKHGSVDASFDQGDVVDGDDLGGISSHGVNFRFLLQARYTANFVDHAIDTATLDPRLQDGYSIGRAFLRAVSSPRKWLTLKFLADFAELSHRQPRRTLKLAYMQIHPAEHITLIAGLFKRTFSLLELLAVADFELADVGPTDVLIKKAELGGRDPGAMIQITPLRKKKTLGIYVGVYDGGLGGLDARPYGLMTARVEGRPIKHLRLGIDGAWRPHGQSPIAPGVPSTTIAGKAVSADASFVAKDLEVRAEWLWGDRTDHALAADASTWMAFWAIGAIKLELSHALRLMPAARFEWLDADREHQIGRRYLFSGALTVMDRADSFRLMLDVSRNQVQSGTFPLGIPPLLLDTSSTTIVVQVQVKV
jgi:hypothetical protein